MELIRIDAGDIAELATQVGVHGAIGAGVDLADDVFEIIVGLIALVIELTP